MWGPYYMNPPDCLHPTRTVVIIDIMSTIRAAMHSTIGLALEMNPADFTNWPPGNIGHYESMMPVRHTKSFLLFPNHYFNISGLLPCCKK